ncbi:hypothetical protein Tco_0258996 [Tanacetum coccineum]
MGCSTPGPETIVHSSGIIMLLRSVTAPTAIGNFSIPWAMDGTAWIFLTPGLPIISLRNLLKQCSYKISEEVPPSTYMRCTQCPPISASIIIGPSVPSSSLRGG